jgi:beta-glucosidase
LKSLCRSNAPTFIVLFAVCAGVLSVAPGFAQKADSPERGAVQTITEDDPAIEARVNDLLARMTTNEKIDLIGGDTPFRTHAIPRLNIPYIQITDGPVGAHIPAPTIAYAAGIGLAATWDSELTEHLGRELGRDARSRGALILLGPGVNIYRAPMNGRNFEYFGEDPFLAARTAVGYIRGVQSAGVAATVKHYLGNNSEYLRYESDSVIDERTMREIYMPAFEAAVKEAHVGAVMDGYNITNGEHMTQNRQLDLEVLKQQWHFPGVLMSDWTSVHDTAAAANAGLDLEMPFGVYFSRENIAPLLANGTISQTVLDDKVRRILRLAATFGWLDHPAVDLNIPRYNLQGREASLKAALEETVLLQNSGSLLPLHQNEIQTIAVIGPTAAQTVTTGGGSGEVVSFANTNLVTGISNALGPNKKTLYSRGMYSVDQLAWLTHFTTAADGQKPGLTVEHYSQTNLQGLVQSTTVEPVVYVAGATHRRPEEQEVNAFYSHKGSDFRVPSESERWTGYFTPEEAGAHAVWVHTDGRFRLYVDDKLVFDNVSLPKYILNQTTMDLTKIPHKVVLEVFAQRRASSIGVSMGITNLATIVDPDAIKIAKMADAVVIAVGFNNTSESEGGDRSFELPFGQQQLIEQVAALNKNTVVAITSGGSVDVLPWKDKVRGMFEMWYPGEEGGNAFAKLLFGDVSPSGHLPISWERVITDNPSFSYYYPDPGTNKIVYREGIFVGYRGYEHNHTSPLFPFGYGLSYTTFAISNLKAESSGEGHVVASFDVKNTGSVAGAAVTQLYVSQGKPSVPRPAKELKGFSRVELSSGEQKHVTIELDPRSFAYFDSGSGEWRADAGTYTLLLGSSSETILAKTSVQLDTPLHIPVGK